MASSISSSGSFEQIPIRGGLPAVEGYPVKKRVVAHPVKVALAAQSMDRFQLAAPGSARIQLLPKNEDTWKVLNQEVSQSGSPFENLKNLADQWAFPGKQFIRNQFAWVSSLTDSATLLEKQNAAERNARVKDKLVQPAREKVEAEVRVANSAALLGTYRQELEQLNPTQTKQARVELPGNGLLPAAVEPTHLARDMASHAAQLGYNHHFHRGNPTPLKSLRGVTLQVPDANRDHVELGAALGQAMLLTRHLVDAPANVCTTGYFVGKAQELANGARTLALNVLDEAALQGNNPQNPRKMGLLLAVGQGNHYRNARDYRDRQPRLVEMVHTPPNWNSKTGRTVLVVGKGIIFDSGGTNLKSTVAMHNMRGDMAGAASVLGLMKTLEAKPLDNIRVVGLMPLTENRISGKSMLPQNIYQARSGKTVEIKNTDAEGRLVLADAMNYGLEKYTANQQKVHGVFDIATLTGGKVRAIGEQNAVGLASNNEVLLKSANQILSRDLRRKTGTLMMDGNYRKMVTESYGSGGQADAINSGGVASYIRAGLVKAGVDSPMEGAKKYTQNPDAFRNNPKFTKELAFAHFGDGAAFVQAVGLDSMRRNGRGQITDENKPNIPWLHFDIAGAEFGQPDPRHGGHEWATGVGVEDLYLTLQGIQKGSVELNPAKTVVQ